MDLDIDIRYLHVWNFRHCVNIPFRYTLRFRGNVDEHNIYCVCNINRVVRYKAVWFIGTDKVKKLSLHFGDENGAKKFSEKLTIDQKKNIAATLEKYVSEKKFYRDPNLKIEQLAKKMHVSYKNLSLVINELIGKTFTTLLNEYRVGEAKKIIAQNVDIESLEDIYTKVGFNSRSTFNRVFKSITGLTPTEYKESLHTAA